MAENELTTEEFAQWWRETGEHELRQLLLWRWDPIGVADYFPNTADEYDGYAPQVVQVLRKGGDADAIAAHLRDVERQSMDGPLTSPKRLTYLGSVDPRVVRELTGLVVGFRAGASVGTTTACTCE